MDNKLAIEMQDFLSWSSHLMTTLNKFTKSYSLLLFKSKEEKYRSAFCEIMALDKIFQEGYAALTHENHFKKEL